MRRVGFAVLVAGVAVAGCSGFRDVFTSHAETAARVGSRELKSARVAEIIGRLGGSSANPQAADLVTNIWVDMSLFADRVADRTLKTDSATIDRLMWPQLAEQKVAAWHDSVLAKRIAVTPAMADSIYAKGDVRLFQHILLMAPGTTAADTAKAKVAAEKLLPLTKKGDAASFGKLALQHSSDGSKSDGGFLYVAPRGAFVKEFDDAAWNLEPGQVSNVVKTQFGFHIIRRPTQAESRDRFLAKAKEMGTAHEDSLYMAELTSRQAIVVKPDAAASVKSAISDLAAARKSRKELVTSKGGSFTVGELVRWLDALPAQAMGQIRQAPDSIIGIFVKTLAQNAILLKEADSAKITVNPTIYQALSLQYKTQVTGLKEAIGLQGVELADSSKTPVAERKRLAALKVDQYFDKLMAGLAQFRPVPPTMSAELRASGDFKIYAAGVSRAQELIVARKKTDSASGVTTPGAPRPGGLQPAPGGPPTHAQPGDTGKKP
ncbi:MAG TPA: peptidylprolyl isomerase [Gemmatimonadales bacterium]|nr:peptidylprolyl isomerase [Gemmatimonadales bacterium]